MLLRTGSKEERRLVRDHCLKDVDLTRAKEILYILTESEQENPYIKGWDT